MAFTFRHAIDVLNRYEEQGGETNDARWVMHPRSWEELRQAEELPEGKPTYLLGYPVELHEYAHKVMFGIWDEPAPLGG